MNDTEITELERLAKAATPGPWTKEQGQVDGIWQTHFFVKSPTDASYAPVAKCQSATMRTDQAEANAAYIAALSPSVVLALISRLREAEGKLRAMCFDKEGKDYELCDNDGRGCPCVTVAWMHFHPNAPSVCRDAANPEAGR